MKSTHKNIFYKLFLIVLFLSSYSYADAQTFVCTDMVFDGYIFSRSELQKIKSEGLGMKIKLSFYDRSVRLTHYSDEGEKDSGILDKVSSNKYRFEDDIIIITLYLNKDNGYLKSVYLDTYDKRKKAKIHRMIFKRL